MWGVPVASWGNREALELCQHLCTLPQAQEALVAPPGSGKQAPGQLVAISSVDYLVAMPSGARALSPVPWDTLLADVWGFLGLNAYKCVGVAAYIPECKCGSVCLSRCAKILQVSLLALWARLSFYVYVCVYTCAHVYVHIHACVGTLKSIRVSFVLFLF